MQITMNVEAGKIYFVRQKTRSGMTQIRADLHVVDEATGQAGVNQSKLLRVETETNGEAGM